MTAPTAEPEGPRPARRDRAAEARAQRGHPRALLPEARDPGPRRFRRRQPRSVAQGGGDRRRRDRLLRRPLHGRDGEDPVAREDRHPARHGRRLQPRGQLPARPVQGVPRGAPRPYRADLHQLLGGGESAERHHRHQSSSRRQSSSTRSRRTRRSSSAPTGTSAAISRASSGATCCCGRASASSTRRFSETELLKLKAEHPGAPVAAHPECPPHIIDHADHVGSTKSILDFALDSPGADDPRRDRAAHHPPDGESRAGQDLHRRRPAATATATATCARTWRSTRSRSSTSRCAT